jgi:dUTP pyrophosphatase
MVLDYALTVNKNLPVLIVADDAFMPSYAQPGDAGADLRSRVATVVPAHGRILVPTGVSLALPDGYVGLVHPRSGLAHKHGITVLNTPGTVDAGYRIAQLVIQQVERAQFIKVERLPDSDRGEGGHGSTGKK